jgi:hypothetical protein
MLDTWEVEIMIEVQGQFGQKVCETLSQPIAEHGGNTPVIPAMWGSTNRFKPTWA